jgi:hypothetical protein
LLISPSSSERALYNLFHLVSILSRREERRRRQQGVLACPFYYYCVMVCPLGLLRELLRYGCCSTCPFASIKSTLYLESGPRSFRSQACKRQLLHCRGETPRVQFVGVLEILCKLCDLFNCGSMRVTPCIILNCKFGRFNIFSILKVIGAKFTPTTKIKEMNFLRVRSGESNSK